MVVAPISVLIAVKMTSADVFAECRKKAQGQAETPVSRTVARVIVAVWLLCVGLAGAATRSESKLYFVVAWIMCIGGAAIIWSGIEPLFLLVIASSGGGS